MAGTRSLAEIAGEGCVRQYGLTLPVDPFIVAKDKGVEVMPKPTSGGVSGMLIRVGDCFAIAYAAHLDNEGFQRFSVAHELGHYCLPGHIDHVLGGNGIHESHADFTSRDPHEVEADQFAVGLLLPREQFLRVMQKESEGLEAIESLARTCKTSLTATAIRFAEYSRESVAMVVCSQDHIEYCCMSESFRSISGLTWLGKGDPIPRRSATYRLGSDPGRVVQADRDTDTTHIRDWFGSGPDLRLVEEVVGLGRYGKTLTVLTPEVAVDEEELEEEAALMDSWTPTFSRSRRR